jgi:hypothetical protein
MTTPDMQAIVRRLEEAEKQIAYLAALLTERSDPDRAVEAQSFIVRDEQGRGRAELGMSAPVGDAEGSIGLAFFDAEERVRAFIGVGGRGRSGIEVPWFEMYNEKGKVAVKIDFEDDNPRLRLFNEDEKTTVEVTSSELGSNLALLNPGGKQGLLIGISLSGDPWLLMQDANGDKVLKLAVDSDGPHLVFGKDNKPHCRLGLSGADQAGHLLFAKDNKVYWSAP